MRIIRIYQPGSYSKDNNICLSTEAAHHVSQVLRMKVGDKLTLFSGDSTESVCEISAISKKKVSVTLKSNKIVNRESPVKIHLYQGLVRADKLDWIMQKATELGVTAITPVIFNRSQYKLDAKRQTKKQAHWQKIMINACEQCGRNQLPSLHEAIFVDALPIKCHETLKIVASPTETATLKRLTQEAANKDIAIVIGPEGGLSENEQQMLNANHFKSISLGPRILRAETAAIASITLMQSLVGDLG